MDALDSVVGQSRFKEAMAETCSPVTIVTVLDDGVPYGTTVSAFSSLSLDPPMITVALDRQSSLIPKLDPTTSFGVNVLRSDQAALARTFASKGTDRFGAIPWTIDGGAPRLLGTAVWLDCQVSEVAEGGDHFIVLGLVRSAATKPAPPLTYHRRRFGTHVAHYERSTAPAS